MFEVPKAEDLLEDAREAAVLFGLELLPEALSDFILANWNDPAAARKDARLEAAYHRVSALWYLRRDRRLAAADLDDGWPFAAFELFSRESCRLAQDRHGTIYRKAGELPHLPFAGCPASHCRCALLGVSRRALKLR